MTRTSRILFYCLWICMAIVCHDVIAKTAHTAFVSSPVSASRVHATLKSVDAETGCYIVERDVKTLLSGLTMADIQTCQTITPGNWTINAPPLYGITELENFEDVVANPPPECSGAVLTYAGLYYTWTEDSTEITSDSFAATWNASAQDYGSIYYDGIFDINLATIKVTMIDLASDTQTAIVELQGACNTTGKLSFSFTDSSGNTIPAIVTTDSYAAGTHTVTFDRTKIPKGTYDAVLVEWDVITAPESRYDFAIPVDVLGNVRYTQYNTPLESACEGTEKAVWMVDSVDACNFTQTTLDSEFASQTFKNGTGISEQYGIVKSMAASGIAKYCKGKIPQGSKVRNTFLQVSSVTGACNATISSGEAVAVYPHPKSPDAKLICHDGLQLVNTNNTDYASRVVLDECPICYTEFNGTDGHIDSYSDSPKCKANEVGDLGNFWTVKAINAITRVESEKSMGNVVMSSRKRFDPLNPPKKASYQDDKLSVDIAVPRTEDNDFITLRLQQLGKMDKLLQLPDDIAQLENIRRYKNQLIIDGWIDGLGNTYVVIVDIIRGVIIDKLLVRSMTTSPSNRYLAYIQFFPSHGGGNPEDQYRLYDLEMTPKANRQFYVVGEILPDDLTEAGRPIYPIWIGKSIRDNVFAPEETKYQIQSNMQWSADSSKLAFAVSKGDMPYVVMVDLPARSSQTFKTKSVALDKQEVCPAECWKIIPDQSHIEYDDTGVTINYDYSDNTKSRTFFIPYTDFQPVEPDPRDYEEYYENEVPE